MDKQNYAQHDRFYVTMLLNTETTYPKLQTLLAEKGIYVQYQDRYALRTSVDQ